MHKPETHPEPRSGKTLQIAGFSFSRPLSRILSRVTIPLGRELPHGSSGVPDPLAGRLNGICFTLHRTGFDEPPCHHDAGGLLPHRFTLTDNLFRGVPPENALSAVCFLFHFPSAFAPWDFPSVLPCGVRTFLGRAPAITRPACRIVARLPPKRPPRAGV